MRSAINALGAGNMESCFVLLEILQSMAEEFGKLSKQVKLELLLKMNYGKLQNDEKCLVFWSKIEDFCCWCILI